jgi:signal transduction histidine kinase
MGTGAWHRNDTQWNQAQRNSSRVPGCGAAALYGPEETKLSSLRPRDGPLPGPQQPAAAEGLIWSKLLCQPPADGECRLLQALHLLEHALAVFDAEDRLSVCNRLYRSWVGRSLPGTLVGLRYEQLLDAWLTDLRFASEVERTRFRSARLSSRHALRSDFEVVTNDGRSLRVSDRGTLDGGIVTTILDRTEEERLLREQRDARAVAEAASSSKSQFISSLSHELRTPLNSVLGFSQLLQRDLKEPLSQRHRTRVDQILKGGEHLLRMIEDLLDLSRIEAGQISMSLEHVDVWEVLDQLQTTLGPSAVSAGIRLEVAKPNGDAIPQVTVDQTRFAQILMNFGSNAIKYNRASGSVRFGVSLPRPGTVRISVSDTGHGIPLSQQARLFQPFQRAGQEAGAIEGTGLGLTITRRLAELMHGNVGFRSVCEQGSEFWVDMPAHDPLSSCSSGTPHSAQGAGRP